MTVIFILMALVIVSVSWNGYKRYQLRKFQLEFSRLNEDLECLVESHKLKRDSLLYRHTKSAIVKTANNLESIHIWSLLSLAIIHKNSVEIKNTRVQVENEMSSNKDVKNLHQKYDSLIGQYIAHKHIFLIILIILGLISYLASSKKVKQCKEYLTSCIEDFPENTTIYTLNQA